MKAAVLLNRARPRLRTAGKQMLALAYELAHRKPGGAPILPEFDAFPRLLDPQPLVLGTESPIDWRALERCDVLFWEWGWTAVPAERVCAIRARSDVPLVMFPGPLDRFWRELDAADLPAHFAALRVTDAIGAMLADTVGLYAALAPRAHVFHLPVPLDVERFAAHAVAPGERDPHLVLLSAPTRVCGSPSQLPIATFLAFRRMLVRRPELRGLCFCYDDEERAQTETVLRELGLSERVRVRAFVRPVFRFLDVVARCRLALVLPHALVQGRLALALACLGVPAVTSDEIETHRRLFPETVLAWHDVDAAADAALRLLDDESFAARVRAQARTAVETYGVAPARARLEHALGVIGRGRAVREGA
jgi:hypothetical protein